MDWVKVFVAVLFAAFVLSMLAPAIMRDSLTMAAVFMIGVFAGMLLENAKSYSEEDR